jgi:hypothetical protein
MNYIKRDNSLRSRKARVLGKLEISLDDDFNSFLEDSTKYFLGFT